MFSRPLRSATRGFHTRSLTSQAQTQYPHHIHSKHLPAGISVATPCIVEKASGCWVTATDGRKYLDFANGIGVTNLGHCHPRVDAAVKKQTEIGAHLQVNCVTSQPILELAAKLGSILPKGFDPDYQVLFSNSGAEAVENAVKLARTATKRQTIIVFQGGFHGRTIATGSLTTAKYVYRSGFQPAMAGVFVAPFPYCHQCPIHKAAPEKFCGDNCCNEPLRQLRLLLKQQTGANEVAAILVEPVQGEGGYIVPPANFMPELRKIADEIGCLLIADEVQSGFGRTGKMFAVEHWNVIPDILVTAKAIANGYPLSAIITPAKIMATAKAGTIGGTYGGNAVSCAASLAVIETFEKDNILANVNERGEQFRAGLKELAKKFPISDVRGLGLMIAIEFDLDRVQPGAAGQVAAHCAKNDMIVLTAGVYETIRFIPALTISKEEVDEGLKRLERAMEATFKQ